MTDVKTDRLRGANVETETKTQKNGIGEYRYKIRAQYRER